MQEQEARELFLKYQADQCTEREKAIVENWFAFGNVNDRALTEDEITEDLARITKRLPHPPAKNYKLWYRFTAAAVILIALGIAVYHQSRQSHLTTIKDHIAGHDVAPGKNKAILTLSDGTVINLSDSDNKKLVEQSGMMITKEKDGQLVYQAKPQTEAGTIEKDDLPMSNVNVVTTPRGGQYEIVLPDGTKVWLNAASSLKFPAVFTSKERQVELTGEAYFEVAKNAAKPFKVKVNTTVVTVLGTHFNINSYRNDQTRTTLLEGAVSLSSHAKVSVLMPGQQGTVGKDGAMDVINADVEQAMAWKNGYFLFNRTNLKEIMDQVSRWYDVDVVYVGEVPQDEEFVGKIDRDVKLSRLLQILELSGIQFKIDHKRIIVKP